MNVFQAFVAALAACGAHKAVAVMPKGFKNVGQDLIAPPANADRLGFGSTVTLNSADGKRLAVGHPNGDGAIYIYNYKSPDWNLIRIFRGRTNEGIGKHFALSADGSRIAFRGKEVDKSIVRLFDVDTGERIGKILVCNDNSFGRKVSMSADGRLIAMSCEGYEDYRGMVRFFYLNNNTVDWDFRGMLRGDASHDWFGYDTSITSDGNRVLISAPFSNGPDGDMLSRGAVAAYDYNNETNSWDLVGSVLRGQAPKDQFGHSIALSGNGRVFVAATPGIGITGLESSIKAWVEYRGVWLVLGGWLTTTTETFNGPVAINDNGSRIAVSSTSMMKVNNPTNRIRVFQLKLGMWEQQGETIQWPTNPSDPSRNGLSLGGLAGTRMAFATNDAENGGYPVRVVDMTAWPEDDGISPTPAPVEQLGGSGWNINVVDISVAFNDVDEQEIKAIYEYASERKSTYYMCELDCKTPLDEKYMTHSHMLFEEDGITRLELGFDVNYTSIVESPVYAQITPEKALLSVCLRVDLLNNQNRSAVSEKNRLYIEIDTKGKFGLAALEAEAGTTIDFQVKVSLDYKVKACQCDETFTCVNTPLSSRTDAFVCLEAPTDSVVDIAGVHDLALMQGPITQVAIEGGTIVESDFTTVQKVGKKYVVRMRLISRFFDDANPDDVAAVGVVLLKFKSQAYQSRFLAYTKFAASGNTTQRRTNEVTDDASTGFDVAFKLLGAAEEDALRSDACIFTRGLGEGMVFVVALFLFGLV